MLQSSLYLLNKIYYFLSQLLQIRLVCRHPSQRRRIRAYISLLPIEPLADRVSLEPICIGALTYSVVEELRPNVRFARANYLPAIILIRSRFGTACGSNIRGHGIALLERKPKDQALFVHQDDAPNAPEAYAD
jgi:hypothetical protein